MCLVHFFSKMKVDCVLFLCFSFFLQISVAVLCVRNTVDPANPKVPPTNTRFVQCSACVGYSCANMDKVDANGFPQNLIAGGVGCPEDFFHDCANFTKEIDFIKNNNENDIDYFNGYVTCISGCENEQVGVFCIATKGHHFAKQLKPIKDFKPGEVIWNHSDGTTHRLDASGAEIKNDPNSTESNTQNNAIKFISIFVLTFYVFIC